MRFILFRHGETSNNVLNIIQGAGVDTPLNAKGIIQAKELAKQTAQMRIDKIYSSHLIRAIQTATLTAASCGLEVFVTEGIEEMHYGVAEGMYLDEAIKRFGNASLELHADWKTPEIGNAALPKGESIKQCIKRVVCSLERLKTENEGKAQTIGVFTHGAVMYYLYCHYFDEAKEFSNCSFFEIEI